MIGIGVLALLGAACGDDANGSTSASASEASTITSASSGSGSGSDSMTGSSPTTSTTAGSDSEGQTTTTTSATDPGTTTDSQTATSTPDTATSTSDTTTSTSDTTTGTTDPGTNTDGTTSTTTEGVDTDTGSTTGTSTTTGEPGCVPTEDVEVSCDNIDNDCDTNIDNVDMGGDGICDCLNIGILGDVGFAPNSNFEAWLEAQGSAVTRTKLLNNPGVVTPAFLANYDLVLVDRIERLLAPEEAAALEAFVKTDGRGLITLIGYNFDNLNPAPERDRANSALAPFGLAYQGGYFADADTPIFDQNHPISMGITDVNFDGGIAPADIGNQGTSEIFATVLGQNAGLAHQTAMQGGRVIVWGDEWITFDSDWLGYADVQPFWVNMFNWAKPKDFCGSPQ